MHNVPCQTHSAQSWLKHQHQNIIVKTQGGHVNAPLNSVWAEMKVFWECLEPGTINRRLPLGPQRKSPYATSSGRAGVFQVSRRVTVLVSRAPTPDLLSEKVQQLWEFLCVCTLGKDGSEHTVAGSSLSAGSPHVQKHAHRVERRLYKLHMINNR